MVYTQTQVSQMRDAKVKQALESFAPIWLVHEEFRPREDALIFNLVYNDPSYGWMNRRFKYDAFNDVLYHMGWRVLNEVETLEVQDKEPHFPGDIAIYVPNAPGYRANAETGRAK